MFVKLIFLCVICCCINSNVFARSVIPHWKMHRTESGSIYCDYHETYHNYSYRYDPTGPSDCRRLLNWKINDCCISLDSETGEPQTYYEKRSRLDNKIYSDDWRYGLGTLSECYHHRGRGIVHDDCWRSHICLECGTVMVHGKFYNYGLFKKERKLIQCECCSSIAKKITKYGSDSGGHGKDIAEKHNGLNKIFCVKCNKDQYYTIRINIQDDKGDHLRQYFCSKHNTIEGGYDKDYCFPNIAEKEEKSNSSPIVKKEEQRSVFFQVKQWLSDVFYKFKSMLSSIWWNIKKLFKDQSFTIKTYLQNPYDIDDMVSGVPQAVKTENKIKLSAIVKEDKSARRKFYTQQRQRLDYIGDMVLLHSVYHGHIYSVKYLLELGFDINGLYPDIRIDNLDISDSFHHHRYYAIWRQKSKKISLLEHHLRTPYKNKHNFIKMYIFLLENGADLKKAFSDGNEPMKHLLALCNKTDDMWMWKLIPLSVAYGATIEQKIINDSNLTNEDFSMYVKNIIGRKIVKPALICEQRNKHLLLKLAKRKINNLKTKLEFYDGIHLFKMQNKTLPERVKQGCGLNVIFSPSAGRTHRTSQLYDKRFYLSNVVLWNDSETLEFLLANGWILGCESYNSHKYIYDSDWILWEFGVDITEKDINSAKDYEVWEKLVSAYKQQLCQFGENDIKKYKDKFYDLPNKATTTKKNNIKTLPEKNIVKKSNQSSTL